MDLAAVVLSVLGSNGLLLFLVKRFFDRKDKKEEEARLARKREEESQRKEHEELLRKIEAALEAALETIRLLAYSRMSEETERLLTQGYATPAERRVLKEMFENYKSHGWNGDMDARLEKVYSLRTDHP